MIGNKITCWALSHYQVLKEVENQWAKEQILSFSSLKERSTGL
jgi:hypothetical protein